MAADLYNVTEKAWMQVQPPKSSFHGSPVLRRGPRFDLVVVVGGPRCWNAAARESRERAASSQSRPFLPGCSLPGATCCFSSQPPPLLLEREPEPEFGCCAGLSNAAPATGFSPVAGGGRLKVGSRQLSLSRESSGPVNQSFTTGTRQPGSAGTRLDSRPAQCGTYQLHWKTNSRMGNMHRNETFLKQNPR